MSEACSSHSALLAWGGTYRYSTACPLIQLNMRGQVVSWSLSCSGPVLERSSNLPRISRFPAVDCQAATISSTATYEHMCRCKKLADCSRLAVLDFEQTQQCSSHHVPAHPYRIHLRMSIHGIITECSFCRPRILSTTFFMVVTWCWDRVCPDYVSSQQCSTTSRFGTWQGLLPFSQSHLSEGMAHPCKREPACSIACWP